MAAYMKNHFEFLGIKTPIRRNATRALVGRQREHVMEAAKVLWARPYREYQYVAGDLLDRQAEYLPAAALADVLVLATRKPWWDTVDTLAKVAGALVRTHPKLSARMDRLATDNSMWLRRIAILHQLRFGLATDTDRLFRMCLSNAADPEFFIRKAIGWALREHAHHDPDIVRRFLTRHGGVFAGLTIREASKHL
jgi:3-methyladenine DNA glycosylase AlkD